MNEPVNGAHIFELLQELPVSTWRYEWEPASVRHLGPMSQDFAAAFGLGSDDTKIETVDAIGVLIVAVQALGQRVAALETALAG